MISSKSVWVSPACSQQLFQWQQWFLLQVILVDLILLSPWHPWVLQHAPSLIPQHTFQMRPTTTTAAKVEKQIPSFQAARMQQCHILEVDLPEVPSAKLGWPYGHPSEVPRLLGRYLFSALYLPRCFCFRFFFGKTLLCHEQGSKGPGLLIVCKAVRSWSWPNQKGL